MRTKTARLGGKTEVLASLLDRLVQRQQRCEVAADTGTDNANRAAQREAFQVLRLEHDCTRPMDLLQRFAQRVDRFVIDFAEELDGDVKVRRDYASCLRGDLRYRGLNVRQMHAHRIGQLNG